MERPSTARIALKWGIISAIISVIFTVVLLNTELWKQQWIQGTIGVIITIVLLILAMKEFKQSNDGFMSYGQGLSLSMLLIAVSSLISTGFSVFYMNVIDESFKEKMLSFQEEMMVKQGVSEDQLNTAMENVERFSTPGFQFLFGIIAALVFGFIIALIVTAFMKKDRPVFE